MSEGYGINKRNFASNIFMIAGPASDPASIKGLKPVDGLLSFSKINR